MAYAGSILDTARSALLTHQRALNVTGHNIANVNTVGFSRQRLDLSARDGNEQRFLGIGAGVEAIGITRYRQDFLDTSLRRESGILGFTDRQNQVYFDLESIIGETEDSGIGFMMDRFFTSWMDMANAPEDSATRQVVLSAGVELAAGFNETANRFKLNRENLDGEIGIMLSSVNQMASQVAGLNADIKGFELGGQVAADLRDERDRLIDQLAEIAGATTDVSPDGTMRVYLSGRILVDDVNAAELSSEAIASNDGAIIQQIIWSDDNSSLNISSGELGGMLEMRDTIIPNMSDSLDILAAALAGAVNDLHTQGFDAESRAGEDFFDTTSLKAADLKLNSIVRNDTNRLAASADSGIGNADIATSIADLADSGLGSLNGLSVSAGLRSFVTELGIAAQNSNLTLESQTDYVMLLEERRQSVSGVNLDEELTLMMQQEQAYQAAAKIVNLATEMLDLIISLV
jgi:flagellar hook-associated protein 1